MATAYIYMADGMEEVECLAPADVLVRAGVRVKLISVNGHREVKGSHGFRIKGDAVLEKTDWKKADMLILPGGGKGTENLYACRTLCEILPEAAKAGKRLAAICAAPSVLGRLGLLEGVRATCYPGYETMLTGVKLTGAGVVTDGLITTASGAGFAMDFGLELAALLTDRATADRVGEKMLYGRK